MHFVQKVRQLINCLVLEFHHFDERDCRILIELIGNTGIKNGLKISADIDMRLHETGKVLADEDLKNANLIMDDFHGNWNYTIGSRDNTNRDIIS